jgi:hypothetical protein
VVRAVRGDRSGVDAAAPSYTIVFISGRAHNTCCVLLLLQQLFLLLLFWLLLVLLLVLMLIPGHL